MNTAHISPRSPTTTAHSLFRAGAAMVIVAVGVSALPGQTAAPDAAQATSAAAKEEVVTLSPFQVETSRDIGYQAQNTLSGSRLNTPLKDTAAPVTVFTP